MANQSNDLIRADLDVNILKHLNICLCRVVEVYALECQVTLAGLFHLISDWLPFIVVYLSRRGGEERGDLIESSLHFEHFCDIGETAHHIEKDLHVIEKHG